MKVVKITNVNLIEEYFSSRTFEEISSNTNSKVGGIFLAKRTIDLEKLVADYQNDYIIHN